MAVGHDSGLITGATDNFAEVTMPAGTTLIRARLACYTYYDSHNTTRTFQVAPPNTLLGVYWKATGGTVPLITDANRTNSEWYVAGYGELDVFDRMAIFDTSVTPPFLDIQTTYANHIDLEAPNYQSGSFDLGVSINFLGGGFWTNASPFITYDFTWWFD